MDPLSISTGVLAALQAAGAILSFCYQIQSSSRGISWAYIQVIEEVRDLRNILEAIQSALDATVFPDDSLSVAKESIALLAETLKPALSTCLVELRSLEQKINPTRVDAILESKTKRLKEGLTSLLNPDETKMSIARLQRCKSSINLAISSHNFVTIRNVERLSISIDYRVSTSCQQLEALTRLVNMADLDKQQKAVVKWLSPLKTSNTPHGAPQPDEVVTSGWFLETKQFQTWAESNCGFLWITGPPGSGKTTLLSQAIERINASPRHTSGNCTAVSAVCYCDFRLPDSQKLSNILGSLLSQICTKTREFPENVLDCHRMCTEGNRWNPCSVDVIAKAIHAISRSTTVFIFVDAMDEMSKPRLLAEELLTLSKMSGHINILATSRNDAAIQQVLESTPRVSLENHLSEVDADIQRYVEGRLSHDDALKDISPHLQRKVLDTVKERSQGMFRWATCQLNTLAHARTDRAVKLALKSLPAGLNETYGRILAGVPPSDIDLIQKTLAWLVAIREPLKLGQLWDALAIEWGKDSIDEENRLRRPQDIVSVGNSLLTVSPDLAGYVNLAHLSVRDFLLSDNIGKAPETAIFAMQLDKAHAQVAKSCLTYLLFAELASGPAMEKENYTSRLKKLPLLKYATKYWFYHFRNSGPDENIRALALRFLSPNARPSFMSWVQVLNADADFKWNVYPDHATPLYYAASLGLDDILDALLDEPATHAQLNAPGSRFGGTPIHAATIREHVDIIRTLLEAGADPGRADYNGVTPLHSAASQGSIEVVDMLLRSGAPADPKDYMDGKTPAEWASLSGHEDLARLIADRSKTNKAVYEKKLKMNDSVKGAYVSPLAKGKDIWEPRPSFFPDYYERRSGLHSSTLLSVEVDGKKEQFDTSFSPVRSSEADDSQPAW
ncbi:hypothetical protein SODALDRAFT_334831 [Sodiomyces alkalinus F11]|uniref:Nephrocystin 3-like N-terminal domain-containing protein n=1 Tax=Sodiomyces alkalinus (strain CBS 110278 / VKM F-3762 / F11) TaxID=1314773 RepID=A0A3N2PT50_SODAK|nr:hypothetical protein SODALDRAFT_334831 [Sodiomyces alkalinus F11]ROT37703.1 hypothetical protein SODALDRAFT_334831 [Sodiomyces alkalinus F11]